MSAMPTARCEFCTAQPFEEVAVSRWRDDPEDRERLTIELCRKHLRRLRKAPAAGFAHRGLRYRAGFW